MKRYVGAGVRKEGDNNFFIDYTYNYPEDIIDIEEPQLYSSIHDNHIYRFGYRFKDDVDSKSRTAFIHSVKQIGDHPLTDSQLDQFIKRPLAYLDDMINLYDIDCMVYPASNRSPLVIKMIRAINDMTSHDMHKCSFELVKQAPTNISFDWGAFESEHVDDAGYRDSVRYIENVLLPKLHDLDYFSIARDVKSKYRKYLTGFLKFADIADIEKFSRLQGANILVVDDINTTGSTLQEILRILSKLNHECNIFVYTLIGK